jgi:hypothetical protein
VDGGTGMLLVFSWELTQLRERRCLGIRKGRVREGIQW